MTDGGSFKEELPQELRVRGMGGGTQGERGGLFGVSDLSCECQGARVGQPRPPPRH